MISCQHVCIHLLFVSFAACQTTEWIENTANTQIGLDTAALQVAYQTDFQKKLNPGLYATRSSASIIEAFNNADYTLNNARQVAEYSSVAYLCYLDPSTDGCENFNDLGCEAVNEDCGGNDAVRKRSLASLCTMLVNGKKTVQNDCFVVSLRDTADGLSRDQIAPWNDEIQRWFDSHNCSSLMYHLKYRCYSNLIKWDGVTAMEEYVDLDQLFDATFGLAAISSFNGGDAIECSSITANDRDALVKVAQLHVEAAALTFASTAVSLARFGISSADVMFRQNTFPQVNLLDKLHTALLLNLFYDGAVQPFREICCATKLCYDYHPMDALVDKTSAFNTFYPGGLLSLSTNSAKFSGAPDIGKVHGSTDLPITTSDAYVYSVLRNAPMKASWQAATAQELVDIEVF